MTDHAAPPAPFVAALMRSLPRVEPANKNDRYDERLNGFLVKTRPLAERNRCPWWPDVTLDPDVGRDEAWRRLRFEVVR